MNERVELFNIFCLVAFLGLVIYSIWLAWHSAWGPATYFLLIGIFIFSLRD